MENSTNKVNTATRKKHVRTSRKGRTRAIPITVHGREIGHALPAKEGGLAIALSRTAITAILAEPSQGEKCGIAARLPSLEGRADAGVYAIAMGIAVPSGLAMLLAAHVAADALVLECESVDVRDTLSLAAEALYAISMDVVNDNTIAPLDALHRAGKLDMVNSMLIHLAEHPEHVGDAFLFVSDRVRARGGRPEATASTRRRVIQVSMEAGQRACSEVGYAEALPDGTVLVVSPVHRLWLEILPAADSAAIDSAGGSVAARPHPARGAADSLARLLGAGVLEQVTGMLGVLADLTTAPDVLSRAVDGMRATLNSMISVPAAVEDRAASAVHVAVDGQDD
jgi:hypothetical protein